MWGYIIALVIIAGLLMIGIHVLYDLAAIIVPLIAILMGIVGIVVGFVVAVQNTFRSYRKIYGKRGEKA